MSIPLAATSVHMRNLISPSLNAYKHWREDMSERSFVEIEFVAKCGSQIYLETICGSSFATYYVLEYY